MLDGKTVLITGANRGLGHAILLESLRRDVSKIYAGVRSTSSKWESEAIDDSKVSPVTINLNDTDSLESCLSDLGPVDLVISSAAECGTHNLLESAWEDIRREWESNFFGPIQMLRCLRSKLTESASVVFIGSKFIHNSLPVIGNYCATKSALWLAAQAIQASLGKNVSVQFICPGSMATEMGNRFQGDRNDVPETAIRILDSIGNGQMLVPVTDDAKAMLEPLAHEFSKNWERLVQRSAKLQKG